MILRQIYPCVSMFESVYFPRNIKLCYMFLCLLCFLIFFHVFYHSLFYFVFALQYWGRSIFLECNNLLSKNSSSYLIIEDNNNNTKSKNVAYRNWTQDLRFAGLLLYYWAISTIFNWMMLQLTTNIIFIFFGCYLYTWLQDYTRI